MTVMLLKDAGLACFAIFRLLVLLFCFIPVEFDFSAVMLANTSSRSCFGSCSFSLKFRW